MQRKTTHVNREAIDVVETYYDDDGAISSRAVFVQGRERPFSATPDQFCDPTITNGLVELRGDFTDDEQ